MDHRRPLSGRSFRVGKGVEVLPRLLAGGPRPFDLVFIDADKASTAEYFSWAMRLVRPGSLIVVDNVVRNGAIADAHSLDEAVQGIQRFIERAAADPRVSATAIQTVGSKGYDGFALLVVNSL